MYMQSRSVLMSKLELSPELKSVTPEVIEVLREMRKRVVIGVVGGSDFVKISEQLSFRGANGTFHSL